jgi:hypothetical protein
VQPTSAGAELSTLVKARGVILERALVERVAGEPVRGSWWGHPKSHEIFRALEALHGDKAVFLCKLLAGKQTYVHRRLWPALLRVQSEASLWPVLSPAGRQLLLRVEREETVQATGRLRLELEQSLRVVAHSLHTASGAHAAVLTPFQAHFSEAQRRAGAKLTLAAAQAALSVGALGEKPDGPPRSAGRRGREKAPRATRR